jgi:predicted dehydrogenase
MLSTGAVQAAAFADPSDEAAAGAASLAPDAKRATTLDELLDCGLDGVVIATPSAAHAAQARQALERGVAVFCQKPLGRTEAEVRSVVDAAREADRLLAVDLSYRFTAGATRIRELVRSGAIGRVHAVELVFHNAYGPDKPWFYDPELSGGGCVMDLGIHLVDLVLWMLEDAVVDRVDSYLLSGGELLTAVDSRVEDYAVATLLLRGGTIVRLACSWGLPAGQDAIIAATFYGARGGAEMRNVSGSFYDFVAERFDGVSRHTLSAPPDSWNVRAAADFAHRLAAGERFNAEAEQLILDARVIDHIYGRRSGEHSLSAGAPIDDESCGAW